jgi:hypothetical protein
MKTMNQDTHKGPHLGMLAIIFTCLFNTGLSFVISLSGTPPYYPGPWESAETIATYFRNQPHDVLMCAFFQFSAAIPLGIFTATIVSRLKFLGIQAAGTNIALFGGLMTAFNLALSALLLWVMAYQGIAEDTSVLRALYYMGFAVGGVGYSVPMGLLIAGVAISSGFKKILPKWIVVIGVVIALCGEVSSLSLLFPKLLFLVPLTRFPGFIWLIIVGFMLPKAKALKLNIL